MKRLKLATLFFVLVALAADAAESQPIRGPWKPDLPVAKGYDEAARALAMVHDNPSIRWE
jgi:hypothetical protein